MKTLWMTALTVACMAAGFAGCNRTSILDERTTPDRAKFGSDVINLAALPPAAPIVVAGGGPAVEAPAEPKGNWTFTVPTTLTREERKTALMDEVSIYMGRPGPNDVPFVVITTTRDRKARCETDPSFKIEGQRDYTMAGNIVHEWTGTTSTGSGFSELLIRRPGAGPTDQVCHAIALAKTEEEQKLALSILGSIVWTPAP
jgi:hypothetical protein